MSLTLILIAALVASASPGPATLAISGTAMARGARPALALASGVTFGSLAWSVAAAAGLSAVMLAHGWILEAVRLAGAGYLAWLALKSLRAAWRGTTPTRANQDDRGARGFFLQGALLHLTNPKAILFFGALYAVLLTPETRFADLALVVAAVGVQSALVFHGYALLFSRPAMMRLYTRGARFFDALFAAVFGAVAWKLLTTRLTS